MSILIGILVALAAALTVFLFRRSFHPETLDAGAVSTRWLSALRRDEPWTRS